MVDRRRRSINRTGYELAVEDDFADEKLIKVSGQSPAYPMQFMLSIYEFADGPQMPSPADAYPKEFVVEHFRAHRRPDTNL